jgi:hypothetical protein
VALLKAASRPPILMGGAVVHDPEDAWRRAVGLHVESDYKRRTALQRRFLGYLSLPGHAYSA